MKKRIIALVLLIVMLLPVSLASCNKETDPAEVAINVYTLYTICEDSTTEDAIKQVELALNRITAYQLGIGIKLIMVTEDKYDALVEEKLAEIQAYKEEQDRKNKEAKENKKRNNSDAASDTASDETSDAPQDVLTADRFIEMLQNGEEYTFEEPRLDIFLVRGFDNYIDLVGRGKLAELDEKLSSEAKLIKDKIYPTFLSAAKVTNSSGKPKTFGVPMNTAIGEYEYVVFDKELLDKYEIDAMTMNTLEDLEYYLRIIKENEPDVVPLANAFDSTYCTYIFSDGFPAMVKEDGVVVNPYEDKAALDYYTYISRYRSLGYLDDSATDKRFAVKFVKGTFEDLEALEKQTGHTYVSAVHSYPVPTNENTLQNLFCINSTVQKDKLTEAAKLLALIETSSEVANILAYGIENENYQLDNNGQVVRLNDSYVVSSNYIGNAFLIHTMAGENPQKWEIFKQQNLDSAKGQKQAKSLGFAYYPNSYADPDDDKLTYEEPDYIALITPIAEKYYSKIMTGEAGIVDYSKLEAEIIEKVNAALTKQVDDKYIDELTATYNRNIEAKYNSEEYKASIRDQARDIAIKSYITTPFKNKARTALKNEIKKQNPDMSTADVAKLVAERMTDEYLRNRVIETVSAAEIDNKTESTIFNTINSKVSEEKKNLANNEEYKAGLAKVLNSAECLREKNALLAADNYYLYQNELAAIILAKLTEQSAGLHKEFSDAIKKEYTKFISDTLKKFDFADESKRSAKLYNDALDNLIKIEKNLKAITRDMTNTVRAEMPDAKADDIDVEVQKRLTDEVKRQKLIELNLVTNAQIKSEYNKVLSDYVNNAVGFVKKKTGTTTDTSDASDASDVSDTSDVSDAETPVEEEETVIDENSDYFALFLETRLKKQYYQFAPLKEGQQG